MEKISKKKLLQLLTHRVLCGSIVQRLNQMELFCSSLSKRSPPTVYPPITNTQVCILSLQSVKTYHFQLASFSV